MAQRPNAAKEAGSAQLQWLNAARHGGIAQRLLTLVKQSTETQSAQQADFEQSTNKGQLVRVATEQAATQQSVAAAWATYQHASSQSAQQASAQRSSSHRIFAQRWISACRRRQRSKRPRSDRHRSERWCSECPRRSEWHSECHSEWRTDNQRQRVQSNQQWPWRWFLGWSCSMNTTGTSGSEPIINGSENVSGSTQWGSVDRQKL